MMFLLTPPNGSRPSLVVETCDHVDDTVLAALRTALYGLGCPNGLLFDEHRCVILRDTFSSLDESSIAVDADLHTDEVLGRLGPGADRSLDARVEQWLGMLSADWAGALPEAPELATPFIADIVPAASGSMIHPVGQG